MVGCERCACVCCVLCAVCSVVFRCCRRVLCGRVCAAPVAPEGRIRCFCFVFCFFSLRVSHRRAPTATDRRVKGVGCTRVDRVTSTGWHCLPRRRTMAQWSRKQRHCTVSMSGRAVRPDARQRARRCDMMTTTTLLIGRGGGDGIMQTARNRTHACRTAARCTPSHRVRCSVLLQPLTRCSCKVNLDSNLVAPRRGNISARCSVGAATI